MPLGRSVENMEIKISFPSWDKSKNMKLNQSTSSSCNYVSIHEWGHTISQSRVYKGCRTLPRKPQSMGGHMMANHDLGIFVIWHVEMGGSKMIMIRLEKGPMDQDVTQKDMVVPWDLFSYLITILYLLVFIS